MAKREECGARVQLFDQGKWWPLACSKRPGHDAGKVEDRTQHQAAVIGYRGEEDKVYTVTWTGFTFQRTLTPSNPTTDG